MQRTLFDFFGKKSSKPKSSASSTVTKTEKTTAPNSPSRSPLKSTQRRPADDPVKMDQPKPTEPICDEVKPNTKENASDEDKIDDNDDGPARRSSQSAQKRRVRIESDSDSESDGADGGATVASSTKAKRQRFSVEEPVPLKTPTKTANFQASEDSPRPSSFSSPKTPKTPKTPVSASTKSRLASFNSPMQEQSLGGLEDDGGDVKMPHLKYDFLQPERIRDKAGKRPDDPEYNEKTLSVPDSFLKKVTPGMRQWWNFKRDYYDTVLFFKVGKFYELYHMDAVVGVSELGLTYMRGEFAHCGFPEMAFGRYAEQLVQKGYRLARIEQTETPDMLNERNRTSSAKADKVVRRDICQVSTPGTKSFHSAFGCSAGAQRTSSNVDGVDTLSLGGASAYLLALSESNSEAPGGGKTTEFGLCLIECAVGRVLLAQFRDDKCQSRLRTLLARYSVAQVLVEKNHVSVSLRRLLNTSLASAMRDELISRSEFLGSGVTLQTLMSEGYFDSDNGVQNVPNAIGKMCDPADPLLQTARPEFELAVRCLGACLWYLRRSVMDRDVLSNARFELYEPTDTDLSVPATSTDTAQKASPPLFVAAGNRMILDAVTLENLDILFNSETGQVAGSLLAQMPYCVTPFGARLLRSQLCCPLTCPAEINDRLDAVEFLMGHLFTGRAGVGGSDGGGGLTKLRKVGDLERSLRRIKLMGSSKRNQFVL